VIHSLRARDSLSVLIVDDNRDFADSIADLPCFSGCRTVIVADLEKAFEQVTSNTFDVAVIDHRLPDGTDIDFLSRIKDLQEELVTVVITAFASIDNTVAALNRGAFAFVTKDSEPETLQDALKRAVENAWLKRENRRLRAVRDGILSSLPDQLVLVDSDLLVHGISRTDDSFLATEPAPEALASGPVHLLDILTPAVIERVDWRERVAAAHVADKDPEETVTIREPEQSARIFGIRFSPVTQTPTCLTLIRIVDLTERIELERRLSESEALAAIGRLTSVIAHEIRNPITGIRALAQVIHKRTSEDDPDRESLEEILSLTDRMRATLADLLSYARPRQLPDGVERQEQAVEVAAMIDEVARTARRWPAAEAREIIIDTEDTEDTKGGASVFVRVERDKIVSALSNLVENALQAVPEGGRVIVRLVRGEGECEVCIEDSGLGIAEEDVPHLFEPFFTRKKGGTGLGLSIVKKVVDGHGGSLMVGRSDELGGACFCVRLPLTEEVAP